MTSFYRSVARNRTKGHTEYFIMALNDVLALLHVFKFATEMSIARRDANLPRYHTVHVDGTHSFDRSYVT